MNIILIFHKEPSYNTYNFSIINENEKCNYNIIHYWYNFPENIIERLKNTINDLYIVSSNAAWDDELQSLQSIKIRFFDKLNEPSLNIFINQIIENVNSIINEHEVD